MSTIVYKGIRIHCEPGVNLLVHNDRIEVVDSSPNFNRKKVKKISSKPTTRAGTVSNFVRENFVKVGITKQVKARTDCSIRSTFARLGWRGSIQEIRAGLFEVTRNS